MSASRAQGRSRPRINRSPHVMRLPVAIMRASLNVLTSTVVFVAVHAFYSCWSALSRLARGGDVARSVSPIPVAVKADAAQTRGKATEGVHMALLLDRKHKYGG